MANVCDIGAAGDGVTDDTEALQHALDTWDGVLRFNNGTYWITNSPVFNLSK